MKTTQSHTPGPWKYYYDESDKSYCGYMIMPQIGNIPIARVASANPNNAKEANARLIATAPDFKWLADRAHAILNSDWTKLEKERSWAAWELEYGAAIAKAEGR